MRRVLAVVTVAGAILLAGLALYEHWTPEPPPAPVPPAIALPQAPAGPPPAGHVRTRVDWAPVVTRRCRRVGSSTICDTLCLQPGGTAFEDEPTAQADEVVVLLFLGSSCEDASGAIWSVHRDSLDTTTYLGSVTYAPGRPRIMRLVAEHGARLVVWQTDPWKGLPGS